MLRFQTEYTCRGRYHDKPVDINNCPLTPEKVITGVASCLMESHQGERVKILSVTLVPGRGSNNEFHWSEDASNAEATTSNPPPKKDNPEIKIKVKTPPPSAESIVKMNGAQLQEVVDLYAKETTAATKKLFQAIKREDIENDETRPVVATEVVGIIYGEDVAVQVSETVTV